MEASKFDRLEKLAEMVNDKINELFEDGEFSEIYKEIKNVAEEFNDNSAVSVEFGVNVFNSKKKNCLQTLSLALTSATNEEPYIAYGDSTPARYLVDGRIMKVPHDHCPNCWGDWGFKFKNKVCPDCGYELGKEVKVLLDSDICPNCEEGKITIQKPECDKCGFVADKTLVHWG